ncbi:N-acetylmuramoyl-L-alanine amidase [Domibacillus mangrovi]|uniref:MurNAc-LAA domain-containing protein n=1 Tax=Domibacillus mangrovi TaxID=1714354 RepID=A0A1Q5P4L8_9BACI|nr:N-acetylmuramoyl-L-alanine amidase [Domibacillus mangrovi]OKL37042.1 hypothetical protein BLL40_05490 [Domibacillus mangrovi]
MSKAISTASGLKNRGPKYRTDLGFLNNTKKSAILIEVCFVDSLADAKLYREHFDAICRSIAESLAGKKLTTSSSVAGTSSASTVPKKEETIMAEQYKKDAAPSPRFEEAKQWAKENGISDGTYPQRPVTREEVWSMLHRMSKVK